MVENIKNVNTFSPDTYFEDDEEFLAGDDKILQDTENLALIQQLDNVVSLELTNLYKDDGSRRSKMSLRSDPPILKVKDSLGNNVDMIISKEMATKFKEIFTDVERAYFGLGSVSSTKLEQKTLQEKFSSFPTWAKNHPVQFLGLVVLLGLTIFSLLIY